MIKLKDWIFEINPIQTGTSNPSTAIFLFSFKRLERKLNEPRYIFSNKNGTRAMSVEEREIGVHRCTIGVMKIFSSGSEKEFFSRRIRFIVQSFFNYVITLCINTWLQILQ